MLGRLERAVERIVDGGIASVFRLRVQPAEIGRQLERAMLEGRTASVGSTLVPNAFEVRLHPEDAAVFSTWKDALSRELEGWLAEIAFARGFSTIGPFRMRIAEDPAVRRRSVSVEGRFDGAAVSAQTERRASRGLRPVLRLVAVGPGDQSEFLTTDRATVGRAADNTVVLDHREISRHHARIEQNVTGWRIIDLGSTNGTWVNGERVDGAQIFAGDDIAFGGIRFTVESG